MEKEDLYYLIALLEIKGIGVISARNLIQSMGSAKAIFEEKPSILAKVSGIGTTTITAIKNKSSFDLAESEIRFVEKNDITPLAFYDPDYPKRLIDCIDAPLLLYYKGNANLNTHKTISVIGTRNATDYGRSATEKFIEDLSDKYPEALIISGLAYGIDIYAHREAIKTRMSTVGVLAHGLDRIYPSTHRKTAVEMVSNGGLLTEYKSGTNPDRQNFVMRNRIVAGMCDALVVVESAERGGALITAEIANSYDRDVFAFPGRSNDIYSQGCNRLINKNKAALIQNASDFEEMMGWCGKSSMDKNIQRTLFVELSDDETKVVSRLSISEPKQINLLSIETNFAVYRLSSLLIELEFKGVVKCLPGGTYLLTT